MLLDDNELYLLEECAPGSVNFTPEAETDKARRAFDEKGDRLIALRDRGLLDFSDGMVARSHRSHSGKYRKIHVRGLTNAGRRELGRREPPSGQILQAVRAKIRQDILARHRGFYLKSSEIISGATSQGALQSSRLMVAISSAVGHEYQERAAVVLGRWREVLVARELTFSLRVNDCIYFQAEDALNDDCGDLGKAWDNAARLTGRPEAVESLEGLRQQALEYLKAELEFAMVTPGGVPPMEPTRSGDQFTIYGNVGALQTGSGSSATVTMYLGEKEREAVQAELRELRRLVEQASLPTEQAKPLIEMVDLALVEAEKPTPNALTLRSLAMGLAMTVQTIGALPGAVEVAHRLAPLLGFQF